MFWTWLALALGWGFAMGIVFIIIFIEEGVNDWVETLLGIFCLLLSPIFLLIAWAGTSIKEGRGFWFKMWKIFKKITFCVSILEQLKKRKDHREMDKLEDEWKIERLGIKSK
jgi:hypothetical protein